MSKKKTPFIKGLTLSWWQTSLFKVSAISFGLLLATYLGDVFTQFIPLLWATMLVPGIYLFYVWLKQK